MRTRIDLSHLSFLIVDDNMHMRQILRSILAGFGARRIYDAADGADGLEIVIDRRPDLIICDWAMTPVSGADFLKLLRGDSDRTLSTTPVIIVTAHARKPVILEAIRVGVHGFVAKPIAPAVLFNRIESALVHQDMHGRSRGTLRLPGTRPLDVRGRQVIDLTRPAARKAEPEEPLGLAFL
ncbi:response regulator [Microvirga tunisiensis]|uniref:Response regulator n=2 Tax=Pannonibacter tanglangensis TaxID=2750084 RepID=A0A7X5J9B3_9HYPH|nr:MULTISPECIES: response regulator [unclassified Pannonibacter]NBN62661.1 response regulator [Pannonibacter sp. XCT-34]NBN78316.1 response regulator [Pannonibacter sp. XCT-53]